MTLWVWEINDFQSNSMGPQGDDDGLKIQKYKMTTNVKKTLDALLQESTRSV